MVAEKKKQEVLLAKAKRSAQRSKSEENPLRHAPGKFSGFCWTQHAVIQVSPGI
jgi:hypothetical protein